MSAFRSVFQAWESKLCTSRVFVSLNLAVYFRRLKSPDRQAKFVLRIASRLTQFTTATHRQK